MRLNEVRPCPKPPLLSFRKETIVNHHWRGLFNWVFHRPRNTVIAIVALLALAAFLPTFLVLVMNNVISPLLTFGAIVFGLWVVYRIAVGGHHRGGGKP